MAEGEVGELKEARVADFLGDTRVVRARERDEARAFVARFRAVAMEFLRLRPRQGYRRSQGFLSHGFGGGYVGRRGLLMRGLLASVG